MIINNYANDHSLDGFLYSISADAEINELYVLSDILITDYSSVFFDYAVLNRPVYFYMYDLEEYKDELRGFYLDIHTELPGKVYEDEETMLKDVKNEVYDYSYLKIFNERFNSEQTGNCAPTALKETTTDFLQNLLINCNLLRKKTITINNTKIAINTIKITFQMCIRDRPCPAAYWVLYYII